MTYIPQNLKLPSFEAIQAELARRGLKPTKIPKSSETKVLEPDWRTWLKTMGPETFTHEFEPYHEKFWDWGWPSLLKSAGYDVEVSEYLAYLDILARGFGKSSSAEWYAIGSGAIPEDPELALYVGRKNSLAVQHLQAIAKRIEGSQITRYYPGLARPRVGKFGQQIGWRQDALLCENGFAVIAVGLEEEPRGLKDVDRRPSLIILDDIDSINDTPYEVSRKEELIARSILPAGTERTKVLLKQNLIHEGSFAHRTFYRHNDILSHRLDSGLVCAFEPGVEIIPDESGLRAFTFKNARPTSKYFDMGACQKFLDDSGPSATLAEYMHDFERSKEELIFYNYDDQTSVITWDEFESVFGVRSIPNSWNKYDMNDWGRTKSDYHANVTSRLAVSSQNTKFPGAFFLYDLFSYPPNTGADDVALKLLESLSTGVPVYAGQTQTWRELIATATHREGLDVHHLSVDEFINAKRNVIAPIIAPYVRKLLRAKTFQKHVMSHEADHIRKVWQKIYGINFIGVNPGSRGGTEAINLQWKVDKKRGHPFRPGKLGYARMFVVVDKIVPGILTSVAPDKLEDSDLARYQFSHWRNAPAKVNIQGEMERAPMYMFDDFCKALCMLFVSGTPTAASLTDSERLVAAMPEQSRPENLLKRSPHEKGLTPELELELAIESMKAREKLIPKKQKFDDNMKPINQGWKPKYQSR